MEYPYGNIIHFVHLKREFKQIHDRLLEQLEGIFTSLQEKNWWRICHLVKGESTCLVSICKLVLKHYGWLNLVKYILFGK